MLCSFHFPIDGYPQRLKAACETVTIRIAFFKPIALKKEVFGGYDSSHRRKGGRNLDDKFFYLKGNLGDFTYWRSVGGCDNKGRYSGG